MPFLFCNGCRFYIRACRGPASAPVHKPCQSPWGGGQHQDQNCAPERLDHVTDGPCGSPGHAWRGCPQRLFLRGQKLSRGTGSQEMARAFYRVSMLEDAASAAAVSVPTDTPTKVARILRLTCGPHQAGRRYGLPPDLQVCLCPPALGVPRDLCVTWRL